MKIIKTTLTTSGNSVAVRLPKELLRLSGLSGSVTLEASEDKIIIAKPKDRRDGWDEKITALVNSQGDPTLEFKDLHSTSASENADIEWSGMSFEEWQNNNGK